MSPRSLPCAVLAVFVGTGTIIYKTFFASPTRLIRRRAPSLLPQIQAHASLRNTCRPHSKLGTPAMLLGGMPNQGTSAYRQNIRAGVGLHTWCITWGWALAFIRHCQATRNTNINNPLAVWVNLDLVQWPGASSFGRAISSSRASYDCRLPRHAPRLAKQQDDGDLSSISSGSSSSSSGSSRR